ncbi:hypothetical protein [Natrinema halophilum]|uniref:Uncharacterized protein n=1 Tax=Natrinema halophilum TaxID=1699371 RepID=A0A7D5GNY8_9EURY|nr:hypothetical protein [Natrinema halophilum]QLG49813.1 hypothetical protein HYG82_13560 [Natrinema halophilum]
MRELRSCDFCGATAAGAFEIVPPELEPTETEQRRVVLCSDCKDRLEALIEPLLARAGAETESHTETRESKVSGAGRTDKTESAVATADESTEKRRRTSRSNSTTTEPNASDGFDAETDSDPNTEAAAESVLEDGITFERTDPTAGTDVETVGDEPEMVDRGDARAAGDARTGDDARAAGDARTGDDARAAGDARTGNDARAAGDARTGNDARAEGDARTDAEEDHGSASATESPTDDGIAEVGSTGTESTNRKPAAYSKVIRLLRNRHFPMQRSAVEELAAGAYDLEEHEVETIVDYAVENGEFDEERELLVRP